MGEAEAEPRHSPDVSFLPVQVGTIIAHTNTVESDGWPPPRLHAAQASTLIYHKRRLIQDRTHSVTQIHILLKSFSCLLPDSWLLLSLFVFLFLFFCSLSFHDVFSPLEDAFCICWNNTRGWQRNKRRAREGETGRVEGKHYSKSNQHTNQILLPPPGSAALWD